MELFDELKNRYILNTIQLINRLRNGEVIQWDDFNNMFYSENQQDYLDVGSEYIGNLQKEYHIFEEDENGQTRLCFDADIKIRPSAPEKIWLKSAIDHAAMPLFLETKTIEKLNKALAEVDDYELNEKMIRKGQSLGGDRIDDELIQKFRLVCKAIKEERFLFYSNRLRNGKVYQGKKAFAFGIEYSIIENRFRASLWSPEEERPVKANLSQLFDLSLGDPEPKPYATVKMMLEERRAEETIQLKIWDKNNCVERAVMLFSQYERMAWWEEDNLIMEIDYYTFDEEELFRNILSLGPMAVVLKPESLRQRMIETLKNVLA
jgi:hypothetical protein